MPGVSLGPSAFGRSLVSSPPSFLPLRLGSAQALEAVSGAGGGGGGGRAGGRGVLHPLQLPHKFRSPHPPQTWRCIPSGQALSRREGGICTRLGRGRASVDTPPATGPRCL